MLFAQSICLLFILISYYGKQNTVLLNVYVFHTYISFLCLFLLVQIKTFYYYYYYYHYYCDATVLGKLSQLDR